MHAHPEPVERMSRFARGSTSSPRAMFLDARLILSLSKDEPLCSWFDKLTTSDVSLCTRILSLSKDEPVLLVVRQAHHDERCFSMHAHPEPVERMSRFCSWFDKLTTKRCFSMHAH